MSDHADIDRHVKVYIGIFVALMVLTFVTVYASTFEHSRLTAISLALTIATIKGSLVACYFMHLLSEKKLILWVLVLTVFFFFTLLMLPLWTSHSDQNMACVLSRLT